MKSARTPVPLQMARMLACGGARVGKDGALLDVGRRTRQIPSAIARALERWIRAAELHVDAETGLSNWDGRKVALAEMLDWMFIAERTRHSQ